MSQAPSLHDLVLDPDGFLLYDNPELYALMFPEPDQETARFARAMLRRFGAGRRVLDVGCGLGRDAAFLQAHGFDVVGLERHPRMAAYAREHFPSVRFVEASMADFALDQRFDAIISLGSGFLYNFTNEAILATLRRFGEHLEPGGLLLLDIRNGAHFLTRQGWDEWLTPEHTHELVVGDQVIRSTARYSIDIPAQLLRRTRSWLVPGRPEPLVQGSAWRLVFPLELRHLLTTSGFTIERMFDRPGPSADEPWTHDDLELSDTLDGSRMHVVARFGNQPDAGA